VARQRYFAAFDLVEIQESFYNLPRLATVEKWRATAPAAFEFVLKAPQLITHEPTSPTYRRLRKPLSEARKKRYGAFKPTREVRTAWGETLALAKALRSRIVVFQCPAFFTPTAEHIRNLTKFFEDSERDSLAFAWEPRGEWPDTQVKTLCKRLDLIHCVDLFQRRPVWGEPAYFRLHGKGGYHYKYSAAELKELLALVRRFKEAYVLFNNTAMFADACRFLRLIGET
jgi:uncharacterized protein YecE (DUF72 family)